MHSSWRVAAAFSESAASREIERLKKSVEEIGYRIVTERGDSRIGT